MTEDTFYGDNLKPMMGAENDAGIVGLQFSRVINYETVSFYRVSISLISLSNNLDTL